MSFQRRIVQSRPTLTLKISKVDRSAWDIFKKHHYLSSSLAAAPRCFMAEIDDSPVAFIALITLPHSNKFKRMIRINRVVVLPDYQGIGIGNQFTEFISSCYKSLGYTIYIRTSLRQLCAYFARSIKWRALNKYKPFSTSPMRGSKSTLKHVRDVNRIVQSQDRATVSFEYVGPAADYDSAMSLLTQELIDERK